MLVQAFQTRHKFELRLLHQNFKQTRSQTIMPYMIHFVNNGLNEWLVMLLVGCLQLFINESTIQESTKKQQKVWNPLDPSCDITMDM